MFIKQISVFIENRHGRLEEFTTLLGENGIDLIALSIADTTNFGILRAIVADNEKALRLVPDSPGGLAGVLTMLRDGSISIEYLYSFVRRVGKDAIIIFRVDQPEKAAALLQEKGVRLLSQEEIV